MLTLILYHVYFVIFVKHIIFVDFVVELIYKFIQVRFITICTCSIMWNVSLIHVQWISLNPIKLGQRTVFYDRKVLESTKIINVNFMNLKFFDFFFISIVRLNNKCKLQHWNEKSRLNSLYKIIDIVLKTFTYKHILFLLHGHLKRWIKVKLYLKSKWNTK